MSIDSLARGADGGLSELAALVGQAPRTVVLTGAGCSTASGIPDYRDAAGEWKRKEPVRFQRFVSSPEARKRYWARSLVGWERIQTAEPNAAHLSLASLERSGFVDYVITQNVDGLHQKAGSRTVNDLHGRIDRVCCLECGHVVSRASFQARLHELNPGFSELRASYAPDGDADLEGVDVAGFRPPACESCGGVMKPDVVFFGESVPRARVDEAMEAVDRSGLLLVAGSSLMVWSGYRFVKRAVAAGVPVAAVNLGATRGDGELELKIERDCGEALAALAETLA